MNYTEYKKSAEGREAARRANGLTKEQMIDEIICCMMRLAGESKEAILAYQVKHMMKAGADHEE